MNMYMNRHCIAMQFILGSLIHKRNLEIRQKLEAPTRSKIVMIKLNMRYFLCIFLSSQCYYFSSNVGFKQNSLSQNTTTVILQVLSSRVACSSTS